MNVIVSNKYYNDLSNLDIDIIKAITGVFTIDELVNQFTNFYYNKMILDITAIKDYQNIETIQNLSMNIDVGNIILLLDDSEVVNSPSYLSSLVSMGIYNFTRNIDSIKFLVDNPNSYKDVAQYHLLNSANNNFDNNYPNVDNRRYNMRILGIKNVTPHAGSTTFTYMAKKILEKKYNVLAVEVDEHDFMYLNDKSLKNCSSLDLPAFIAANQDKDVILVDLNDQGSISACTEVLYLIEPGLIKLNKLIRQDKRAFEKLAGKRIVLNRSILSESDVHEFEYESHSKVFYNMPYFDDKDSSNKELVNLLMKMGFARLDASDEGKGKIFNIFK